MKGIIVCEDNTDLSVLSKKHNPMKLNAVQLFSLLIIISIVYFGIQKLTVAQKIEPNVAEELMIDIPQISPHYFDYSRISLAKAKQNGRTVLFFAATSWCNTCSALDLELKDRSSILPSDVSVLKIDYDHDVATNRAYGISSQHTMILLDKNGDEIKRWVGGGIDTLISEIN